MSLILYSVLKSQIPSNRVKDPCQDNNSLSSGEIEGAVQGQGEERPSSAPIWTREWVFTAQLHGAGGLDRYKQMWVWMNVAFGCNCSCGIEV